MKISRRLIGITGMRDIIERRIPVLTLDSRTPGPNVWLTACIHGDEAGGIAIVHDVFAAVRKSGLQRGVLRALPLINSMGFENNSRFINADREDLNRCFPGATHGSMGERLAGRIFDAIMKTGPDLVIDLHNDWIHSVPYILVEPLELCRSAESRERSLRIAREAGLLLVEDSDASPGYDRTLTAALAAADVAAFTIEAGGAYAIVEQSVSAGCHAVLAMLSHIGMCGEPTTVQPNPDAAPLLRYTNRPLCQSNGLVRFEVTPGDRVESEQAVARVFSAFGSCEETLRAERDGIVLGIADHARAAWGCEVIAIAEHA
jgi:predicted deacylase